MKPLIVAILALAFVLTPSPAAAQGCNQGGLDQSDFAGVYISPAHQMRVEVFPCGGLGITWDNAYGRHQAAYVSIERLEGGGVIGRRMDGYAPVTLDNANGVIVKPAEPGWIEVMTFSPYGDMRVYRLAKLT